MSESQLTEAEARYYHDLTRLRGRRGLLLALLVDEQWHPNHELAAVAGLSYNDSIHSFRKEGWIIESRPARGGVWEYRLGGKADPPTGHKPMSRPQKVVAGHYMHVISERLGHLAAQQVSRGMPEWLRYHANPIESSS